jgi:hypothetical protein
MILSRRAGETLSGVLSARDTVMALTPAAWPTSCMVMPVPERRRGFLDMRNLICCKNAGDIAVAGL